MSDRMVGNRNPMKDPEVALKGFLNRKDRGKMTSAEKFFYAVCNDLGVEFVGDGELVVGTKVPDFVVTGKKKLIEVWDTTQSEFLGRDAEWRTQRAIEFNREGFDVLFVPLFPYPMHSRVGKRKPGRAVKRRQEVARIRKLVSEFARNGEEVKSITKVSRKDNPKAWARLAGTKAAKLTVYNFEVEGTHTYIADGMIVHNCDTDYTSDMRAWNIAQLRGTISTLVRPTHHTNNPLVVITGGEPFRQPIGKLVRELCLADYTVQIETNGTLFRDDLPWLSPNLFVICSPKTAKVHDRLSPYITAWKYPIRHGEVDEQDGLPTVALGGSRPYRPPSPKLTYVLPMDEQHAERNAMNRAAALGSAMQFGYVLQTQLHKTVGVP